MYVFLTLLLYGACTARVTLTWFIYWIKATYLHNWFHAFVRKIWTDITCDILNSYQRMLLMLFSYLSDLCCLFAQRRLLHLPNGKNFFKCVSKQIDVKCGLLHPHMFTFQQHIGCQYPWHVRGVWCLMKIPSTRVTCTTK